MNLDSISKAIAATADRQRIKLEEHQKALGEPDLFVPWVDSPGGVGYFLRHAGAESQILAYQKYANGYSLYPSARFSRSLVEKLYEIFKGNAP